MKKIPFLLLAFLMSTVLLSAQNDKDVPELQALLKTEVGFHGVGLALAYPLDKKWTIDLSLGKGLTAYHINPPPAVSIDWVTSEGFSMFFKSEVKYIYNRKRLLKKGRLTIYNSGSYMAFQTKYSTRDLTRPGDREPHNVLLNEVHWGTQSSLGGSRFLFNLHLGIGYGVDFYTGTGSLYPAFGFKFSYVISIGKRVAKK